MIPVFLTWDESQTMADQIIVRIEESFESSERGEIGLFGVPRGGVPVALMVFHSLKRRGGNVTLLSEPRDGCVIVDDIVDSGRTRTRYAERFPQSPFYALVDKTKGTDDRWVTFPWEINPMKEVPETIQENVVRILEYIGEDPNREGLRGTPDRVVRSFSELFGGYQTDPWDHVKVFEGDSSDEMVVLKDIEFYSTCEHHLLPFHGVAHIAYLPAGKVIGISKLARVLEVFSRRLQIQERLCGQVTEFLDGALNPLGAACVLEAHHFCMTRRGVQKQNSVMVTSSLTGCFRSPEVRAEFFQLIRGQK